MTQQEKKLISYIKVKRRDGYKFLLYRAFSLQPLDCRQKSQDTEVSCTGMLYCSFGMPIE